MQGKQKKITMSKRGRSLTFGNNLRLREDEVISTSGMPQGKAWRREQKRHEKDNHLSNEQIEQLRTQFQNSKDKSASWKKKQAEKWGISLRQYYRHVKGIK